MGKLAPTSDSQSNYCVIVARDDSFHGMTKPDHSEAGAEEDEDGNGDDDDDSISGYCRETHIQIYVYIYPLHFALTVMSKERGQEDAMIH